MTENETLKKYKDKVILDKYIKKIQSLKKDNELSVDLSVTQKITHHASWDNHILTLSTAALGFIFGVLPLSEWCYIWWAISASISFVLAIFFAMACFLYADKTFNSTSKLQDARSDLIGTMQEDRDMREYIESLDDAQKLNEKGLNEALNLAQDVEDARVKYNEICEAEVQKIHKDIGFANKLNEFKTYSFLLGLILISVFVFVNNT